MARVRKATRGEVLRAAQKDASYLEALEGKVGTLLRSNVLFTTKRALIQMQFTLYRVIFLTGTPLKMSLDWPPPNLLGLAPPLNFLSV